MSWADDEIAGPMGYQHCVLFDCARDAISAYHDITDKPLGLPENICPELVAHMRERGHRVLFGQVSPLTGQTPGAVHLYGYQAPSPVSAETIADLSIDPLMTGWIRRLKTESAVISFGRKKILSLGYGGAFLTNNVALAEELEPYGHWNDYYTDHLIQEIKWFHDRIKMQWLVMNWWDQYLGDSLIRIPGEQLMPWRAMRRAPAAALRKEIVDTLRNSEIAVGTNYPALKGFNEWGDTVLNFPCSSNVKREEVIETCRIIKGVLRPSFRIGIDG